MAEFTTAFWSRVKATAGWMLIALPMLAVLAAAWIFSGLDTMVAVVAVVAAMVGCMWLGMYLVDSAEDDRG